MTGHHLSQPPRRTVARRFRGGMRAIGVLLLVLAPLTLSPLTAARADNSQVTVPAPAGGEVTVEKTKNLVNEVIHVSWTGFKPSFNPQYPYLFNEAYSRYGVRIYQCRGVDPAAPTECYGSWIYDYPGRDSPLPNVFLGSPDGPSNHLSVGTGADGTGGGDVEVMTKSESVSLGCTSEVPCSIVVVPNYGDETRQDSQYPDYPACAGIRDPAGQCSTAPVYSNDIDAEWAWKNRVVVPISFSPSDDACALGDSEAALLGAPNTERAFSSWVVSTCTADSGVNFDYTAQGEELARNDFLRGDVDVALTARPAGESIPLGSRAFTYAPVATSSLVVSFRVDDPTTGLQINQMKLNPRLLAKLVTESYGYGSYSPDGADYGNPATRGNPQTIFDDPEFLELNPGVIWPKGVNNACATPLLLADRSDLTYDLTAYIAADPNAAAFLAGTEDEWGTAINATFDGMLPYPTDSFELRDPDDYLVHAFSPLQGLNTVARRLVGNTFAGTSNVYVEGPPPSFQKCGPEGQGYQPPGSRAFIAVIDSGNSAAYRFPQAEILNAGGKYVGPTADAVAAAVGEMTVNADGITRSPDFESANAAAYPLTVIDYAMVPTDNLEPAKAEAIGRILDYAAGPGQRTDQVYGGLPPGFLPLGSDLVAETEAAAVAVRAGVIKPSPSPTPTEPPFSPLPAAPGGGGYAPVAAPGGSAAVPQVSAAPVPTATPSATATPSPSAAAFAPIASQTPSWMGVIVPIVLLAGLAAAAVGAAGSYLLGHGGLALPRLRRSRNGPV